MKLSIPISSVAAPPGKVSLGPPELVQRLGRTGVCVLTIDGIILTEGEAQFRDSPQQARSSYRGGGNDRVPLKL